MNKILTGALLLLCSFSAAAQTPRDSIAFATAEWRTADLGGGAECPLCPDRHVRVAARASPSPPTPDASSPPRSFHLDAGRVHERSGQSRRRGHRRQRQLLQRQNLRTGHLRPARQKNRGTHHPRGDVAHQRRHRLQGPQGTPDGDFPVRHDAVRRRGAPLPLGRWPRPGADRRAARWSNTPPGAASTPAAIPGR